MTAVATAAGGLGASVAWDLMPPELTDEFSKLVRAGAVRGSITRWILSEAWREGGPKNTPFRFIPMVHMSGRAKLDVAADILGSKKEGSKTRVVDLDPLFEELFGKVVEKDVPDAIIYFGVVTEPVLASDAARLIPGGDAMELELSYPWTQAEAQADGRAGNFATVSTNWSFVSHDRFNAATGFQRLDAGWKIIVSTATKHPVYMMPGDRIFFKDPFGLFRL